MTAREQLRAQARAKLADLIGPDEADAVMPPLDWEQVATKADIVELRSELREVRGELLEKIGALDGRIGSLDGRVRAQTWKMFTASFVSSFSTAGLVLAAVQLG